MDKTPSMKQELHDCIPKQCLPFGRQACLSALDDKHQTLLQVHFFLAFFQLKFLI
jgi:hypothetical protein